MGRIQYWVKDAAFASLSPNDSFNKYLNPDLDKAVKKNVPSLILPLSKLKTGGCCGSGGYIGAPFPAAQLPTQLTGNTPGKQQKMIQVLGPLPPMQNPCRRLR